MREIKFRAWDKSQGKMDYDVTIMNGCDWDLFRDYEIKGRPIMQYTGLKDKNGKEIYEGDIVNNPHDEFGSYEIVWDELEGGWSLGDDSAGLKKYSMKEFWEVIGNIYENPELLEGK